MSSALPGRTLGAVLLTVLLELEVKLFSGLLQLGRELDLAMG